MATGTATWPSPSESRSVRRRLYVAEGVTGGGIAAFLLVPLQSVPASIESLTSSGSAGLAVVVLILLYIAVQRFTLLFAAVRDDSIDRPPFQQDWHETRQWRWVVATGVLVVAVVAIVTVAAGAERAGWTGRLAALAFGVPGFGWYLYCWHRPGELFETRS
jgi:hypothetical protein